MMLAVKRGMKWLTVNQLGHHDWNFRIVWISSSKACNLSSSIFTKLRKIRSVNGLSKSDRISTWV
jgi:hypothetical protein